MPGRQSSKLRKKAIVIKAEAASVAADGIYGVHKTQLWNVVVLIHQRNRMTRCIKRQGSRRGAGQCYGVDTTGRTLNDVPVGSIEIDGAARSTKAIGVDRTAGLDGNVFTQPASSKPVLIGAASPP